MITEKIAAGVAAIITLLGVIAGIFYKGKSEGKQEVKQKQNKEALKRITEANEIDVTVKKIPDADIDAELSEFMRDNP